MKAIKLFLLKEELKSNVDLFVDYCNETYEIIQEDGSMKLLKGVQLIDDIGLLEEIIQWNENLNVDRIIAAMGMHGYAHYLRVSNLWKPLRYKPQNYEYEQKEKPQQVKKLSHFKPQNRTNRYFRSR